MINGNIWRWGTSCPDSGDTPPLTPPLITQDPDPIDGFEDTTDFMFVVATGTEPLSYQWQWSVDDVNFFDAEDSLYLDGVNEPVLDFVFNRFQDGLGFRCIVTNASGEDISNIAGVEVYEDENYPLAIWAGDDGANRAGWETGGTTEYGFAIPTPVIARSFRWNDGANNFIIETNGNTPNGELALVQFRNVPEFQGEVFQIPWDDGFNRYQVVDARLTDTLQDHYENGQNFFALDAEYADVDDVIMVMGMTGTPDGAGYRREDGQGAILNDELDGFFLERFVTSSTVGNDTTYLRITATDDPSDTTSLLPWTSMDFAFDGVDYNVIQQGGEYRVSNQGMADLMREYRDSGRPMVFTIVPVP